MNNINFENFKKIFDTEQKCINLLIENNYIQTTYCCNCNSNEIRKLTKAMKNNYMCKACKKVSNIFKNTIFFNSPVSLVDWFYIIHFFINFFSDNLFFFNLFYIHHFYINLFFIDHFFINLFFINQF